jgi:hypothetical protein
MSSQPAGTPEPPKGLDALVRAAFERGVEVGTRYPAVEAIPGGEVTRQFRVFMDAWNGRPE